MNHLIAHLLITLLMNNPDMNRDKIHTLLMVTEPLMHEKELSEEQIDMFMEQLDNIKDCP